MKTLIGDFDLSGYLQIAIAIFVFVLFFAALASRWLRNRRAQKNQKPLTDDLNIEVGSTSDLLRAENELRSKSETELLEQLLRTHVLIDRLSTFQGFSQNYIDDLTSAFNNRQLHLTAIFRQTMPLGAVSAYESAGFFELYVPFEEEDAARALLTERVRQG